jgi:hypothetical protein
VNVTAFASKSPRDSNASASKDMAAQGHPPTSRQSPAIAAPAR